MTLSELVDRAEHARRNHERARAFGAPVLHSLHPDAVLLGFSIASQDGEPVMVETNQVLRSSLTLTEPVSFSVRTWKRPDYPATERRLHALDHLMNVAHITHDESVSLFEAAVPSNSPVIVDGRPMMASVVQIHDHTFANMFEGDTMITIASPIVIFRSPFSSGIPA